MESNTEDMIKAGNLPTKGPYHMCFYTSFLRIAIDLFLANFSLTSTSGESEQNISG